MAFVSCTPENAADNDTEIDIIGVPAIGADPHNTWNLQQNQWLGPNLHAEIPSARVLLYDHLTVEERAIELKPTDHPDSKAATKAYANVRDNLAKFGIEEWTDRFLETIRGSRNIALLRRRPIIFLCHSTGGIIVKQALTKTSLEKEARKTIGKEVNLAAICLGITFFSTPHHGSRVLAGLEFATPIKNKLNLKFEMSEYLLGQFALQNSHLELLNHKFAAASLGIKIWNYYETRDTQLKVLVSEEGGGEVQTKVNLLVVDEKSAVMTTTDVLIEEEEPRPINTTHVGTARFADDKSQYSDFRQDLKTYIQSTSAQDRAAHHALTSSIMTDIKVDVHQFYQMDVTADAIAVKVWSVQPTLQDFLEHGPEECLKTRLHPPAENGHRANGEISKPYVRIRNASEVSAPAALERPITPTITVSTPQIIVAPMDKGGSRTPPLDPESSILEAPTIIMPKTIHTRRPPLNPHQHQSDPDSVGHLAPASVTPQTTSAALERNPEHPRLSTREPRPQRARTYQAPSKSTDRFRWIHVPYTHPGFVASVLKTISHEKENMDLHTKLLSPQVWSSQHNRSRHASSHARFVRSACKCLLPKTSEHHSDELLSPTSSIGDAQLALYLPYLHWDSFDQLRKRADVIAKRGILPHARPVDREIAKGKSVECKLIWQYLHSKWPLHTRRTLDQYGYPSLRNTTVRDGDQVIYKQTRNPILSEGVTGKEPSMHNIKAILHAARAPGPRYSKVKTMSDGAAKVLIVDQLWIFVVDDETIVTFCSPKEKTDDNQEQGDVRHNLYHDVNGDYARECEDCFDFAALAVFHAVKALLDYTNDPNLQVFRIFEEYISELTEQQTKSFKEFRDNHRYRDPRDLDVDRLPQYVDNRDDLNALLELRDIEDELTTIHKLFTEQHKTIQDMTKQYEELNNRYRRGMHGSYILREVNHCVDGYLEQVHGMKESAEVALKAFEKLLDMKQKQANIVEAHLAREQTEVAADQSRSVMIFTIFTIIFLPLSFFASVFGMNIQEWSGVGTNIDFYHAFVYMGCISLAVIVVALLVAFNRYTRRVIQKIWKVTAKPITNLFMCIPSRRVHGLVHYWDVEHGHVQESPVQARERSRSRPGRTPHRGGYEMHIFGE